MRPNRKADPVQAESLLNPLPPGLQARLQNHLGQDEKVLWAAQVRVFSGRRLLNPVAYVLTDQRAIVLTLGDKGLKELRWDQLNRVTIRRRFRRPGKLTLVALPSAENNH